MMLLRELGDKKYKESTGEGIENPGNPALISQPMLFLLFIDKGYQELALLLLERTELDILISCEPIQGIQIDNPDAKRCEIDVREDVHA